MEFGFTGVAMEFGFTIAAMEFGFTLGAPRGRSPTFLVNPCSPTLPRDVARRCRHRIITARAWLVTRPQRHNLETSQICDGTNLARRALLTSQRINVTIPYRHRIITSQNVTRRARLVVFHCETTLVRVTL